MSTNKDPEDDLVSVPIRELIKAILGDEKDGLSCCQIPSTIAIILSHKLKTSLKYKIDFLDQEENERSEPLLWRYSAWKEDSDKWYRDKERDEKERVARWIHRKNLENLTKGIMKSQCMTEPFAQRLAFNLLQKKAPMEVMNLMGLNKLITKEEEL